MCTLSTSPTAHVRALIIFSPAGRAVRSISTLRVMSEAYDAVLARLGIKPNDPRSSVVASQIVTPVYEGERNPTTLRDKVCAHVKGSPYF